MAKKKKTKKVVENEFGEEIEVDDTAFDGDDGDDAEETKDDSAPKDETFANAEGLLAVKHAKILAQKEAALKKLVVPSGTFYTMKGEHKVIKVIVKIKGVYQVFMGNLKKKAHAEGLKPFINSWKKQGAWVGVDSVAAKILEIREKLQKEAAAKPPKKGK